MNRRLIPLIVLIPILVGGGIVWNRRSSAGAGAGQTQYKVAKVEVGQVKKTVSSTGTLQAWRVVDIKARAGGELSRLRVDVGSEVKVGDLLATLDPLDSQLTRDNAIQDERSALARLEQSQKTLQLQKQQAEIAIADARASLLSSAANIAAARNRLATARQQSGAQPQLTAAAIASAQANYDQAAQARQQLDATLPQQRAAARATYEQAIANRNNLQIQVDRQKALVAKGFVSQQSVDTLAAQLAVNDAQVTTAKVKLDTLDAELRATVESADARVAQTQAALSQAQANRMDIPNRKNSVGEAEASLRQAQAAESRAKVALEQAIANRTNNGIRALDITSNQAQIARARSSRLTAQTVLDRTKIAAPMAGIVLQKYVEEGTIIPSALSLNATGTSIVQIGDISRMFVDVTVDETDIAKVQAGQSVDISIEAYPGMPFEGKVTRIDPQAVVLQNVTSVHVRVEVDNSSPVFRLLKPGMNATCEFVSDKVEDAVKVPTEAVREDDEGKFVETAAGGKPAPPDPKTGVPADADALVDVKLTKVRLKAEDIGIEGNDSIEIKNGLKEGDTIVTQIIEPTPQQAAGSPFGGGNTGRGFGGGGGGRR